MVRKDENKGLSVGFVDMFSKTRSIKLIENSYGEIIQKENRHMNSYPRNTI
jgi:hypothetical protein